MAITKEKKEEILKGLEEKFGRAKSVYFADYRGLTVKEMGEMRKKLREDGVDYVVAKKTLIKLSVKNSNLPEIPSELMEGPVGAAFGYEDEIAPVKALHLYGKRVEALNILGGLVEGKYVSKAQAIELAKLPSKDELLAKLVGSIKAPISGFHGILSGILRNFVYVINAYKEEKAKAAPASEAAKTESAEKTVDDPSIEEKAAEEKTQETKIEEQKQPEEKEHTEVKETVEEKGPAEEKEAAAESDEEKAAPGEESESK